MAQTVTLRSTGVASGDSAGSGIYAVGSTEGGTGHVYILNFPLNVDFSRKIITKIEVRGYRYVASGGTGRNCILGFCPYNSTTLSASTWVWVMAGDGVRNWVVYEDATGESTNSFVDFLKEQEAAGATSFRLRLHGSGNDYNYWLARTYTYWSVIITYESVPATPTTLNYSWDVTGSNIPVVGVHVPTVSWNSCADTTSYTVEMLNGSTVLTSVSTSSTSYKFSNITNILTSGTTTLKFRVRANNSFTSSGYKTSGNITYTKLTCNTPNVATSATASTNPLFTSGGSQLVYSSSLKRYSTLSTGIRFYFKANGSYTGSISFSPTNTGAVAKEVTIGRTVNGTDGNIKASYSTGYVAESYSPLDEIDYDTITVGYDVPYKDTSGATAYKRVNFSKSISVLLKINNPSGTIQRVQLKQGGANAYPKTLTSTLVDCPSEWLSVTALTQKFIDAYYPIGSIIYMTNNTNPSSTLGGTWNKLQTGVVIIGAGSYTDSNGEKRSFTANSFTNGNLKTVMTENQCPEHKHTYGYVTRGYTRTQNDAGDGSTLSTANTSYTGGSAAQNTKQPYIVVNIYERVG